MSTTSAGFFFFFAEVGVISSSIIARSSSIFAPFSSEAETHSDFSTGVAASGAASAGTASSVCVTALAPHLPQTFAPGL